MPQATVICDLTEGKEMISIEKVGLVLMVVAALAIIALLGPASLGALLGAVVAVGLLRTSGARRS